MNGADDMNGTDIVITARTNGGKSTILETLALDEAINNQSFSIILALDVVPHYRVSKMLDRLKIARSQSPTGQIAIVNYPCDLPELMDKLLIPLINKHPRVCLFIDDHSHSFYEDFPEQMRWLFEHSDFTVSTKQANVASYHKNRSRLFRTADLRFCQSSMDGKMTDIKM